jgi:diadenylate cyclase
MHIGFLTIGFKDLIDIALVAFLLYQAYQLLKGSIASRVFLGYLAIYVAYLVVNAFGMELTSNILGQFMNIGIMALIVIFQPEIRRFLIMIGRGGSSLQDNHWIKRFFPRKTTFISPQVVRAVAEAARHLAIEHTGALVVMQRETLLEKYIDSGDELDASVTKRLILSIFQKNSPLHDGAVIIAEGRLKAAGCRLPVSENDRLPALLGFRHRAALGLSEESDAAIIVVSEESGEISFIHHGGFFRNMSVQDLEEKINQYFG